MPLNAPFDRLGAARGNPNGRVRLLDWAWPDGTIFELVKFSVEAPDRIGPCGHDQIISFLKSPAGFFRVYSVPYILRGNAAHEPSDQPALRKAVDHRVFFGNAHRVIAQRKNISEHADFDSLGSLAQSSGDKIWRRHGAVGTIVMLIENDAVQAKLFTVGHLV